MEAWKTILLGYTFLKKDADGNKIKKSLEEYDEEENREFKLNYRAIYILVCAMDRTEYNRICQCKKAKEAWRILEITHKGTNQVKDSKVRIIFNDYEMFEMKPNESIVEMFTTFKNVVNGLEGLGNRVSEEDRVSKILTCLPPKWNSKMEAIEKTKNLKELPLEDLIGSLMTYEMNIASTRKGNERGKKKEKYCTQSSRRESR